MAKLTFEGIKNIRELGGIKTRDGHKVKKGCFLKSGHLYRATDADLQKLRDDYQVKLIVDLRTEHERNVMPDPCIKGVSDVWNPLYMENIQGLAFTRSDREILEDHLKALFIVNQKADEKTEYAMNDVRQMVMADDFDPDAYMARMYQKFVNNQIIQKQMKQFFALLMNNREGAILWHCSAGKDRTGMITALVLYALGVSKEDIIEDYMASQESSEDAVDLILEKLFPIAEPGNAQYQAIARRLFAARECYIEAFFDAIEKDYISVDNYLQKALELHVDNYVRLKTLYLE